MMVKDRSTADERLKSPAASNNLTLPSSARVEKTATTGLPSYHLLASISRASWTWCLGTVGLRGASCCQYRS